MTTAQVSSFGSTELRRPARTLTRERTSCRHNGIFEERGRPIALLKTPLSMSLTTSSIRASAHLEVHDVVAAQHVAYEIRCPHRINAEGKEERSPPGRLVSSHLAFRVELGLLGLP